MHRRPRSHCPQHESRRCESVSVNIVAYEQECVGVTEPDSVSTRQSALALAAGLRSTEHKRRAFRRCARRGTVRHEIDHRLVQGRRKKQSRKSPVRL